VTPSGNGKFTLAAYSLVCSRAALVFQHEKPCFHLIKDEDETEAVSQLAQSHQISELWFDDSDVLKNGLRDQRGYGIFFADILY